MWLGEFDLSSIVDLKFTTRGTTGAPATLSGTPAVSVYKSNSTTESTAGVTLTVDFDSRTGLNHVRIDTSADGTFYATGSDFQIVITTGTVGGTSVVGEVVGSFTIRNRAGLKPATAGRTLVVDAAGLADANVVKAGASGSGVAWASGAIVAGCFATGAITAGAIAADAIGASELAADAIAEIQNGLATASELQTANDNITIIKGATQYLPGVSSGAAGGLLIAGSNAATTFASLTCTGALTVGDGVIITASTLNRDAVKMTGNGTGHGLHAIGGNGVMACGAYFLGGSLTGSGLFMQGTLFGAQFLGATGAYFYGDTDYGIGLYSDSSKDVWSVTDTQHYGEFVAQKVWNSLTASHIGGGSMGLALGNVATDTDNIQTRLPAALVGGRMDASVGAMAAGTVTNTAIADAALTSAKFSASTITGVASGILEKIDQLWRRFFKKAILDAGASTLKNYADDGTTVLTTQTVTTVGDVETQGPAT